MRISDWSSDVCSSDLQRATADGRTVAQSIVDAAGAENRSTATGSVGGVIGATMEVLPDLDALEGPVLAPGVGAQGGRAEDLGRIRSEGRRGGQECVSPCRDRCAPYT